MTPRDMAKRANWVRKLSVEAMTPEEREAYEESMRPKKEPAPELAVPVTPKVGPSVSKSSK